MKSFSVTVESVVTVTLDETKFTKEFMEEFNSTIFAADDLRDHAEHLGWLFATGRIENGEFVEGYGSLLDMGIEAKVNADVTDVEPV